MSRAWVQRLTYRPVQDAVLQTLWRVRDDEATLTLKGAGEGASRAEYEYDIPVEDADEILDTICLRPWIRKNRHVVEHGGFEWEVDEFLDENEGLVIAEIELESEDQEFLEPDWVGDEVTGDTRYYNANSVAHPHSEWHD